jgi:hypothetical protein
MVFREFSWFRKLILHMREDQHEVLRIVPISEGKNVNLNTQCKSVIAVAPPLARSASVIASKPATRDRLKTGHCGCSGTKVDYFESESLGKLVA